MKKDFHSTCAITQCLQEPGRGKEHCYYHRKVLAGLIAPDRAALYAPKLLTGIETTELARIAKVMASA